VAASEPSPKQHEVFTIVKNSLEAGLRLVKQRYAAGAEVKGWEVDQTCRDLIEEAGYGPYFVHRTGHNIHTQDHGEGANIDNYETQDQRRLIPGTCFSLEPGIYLEGDFGVRLEYDVFIHSDGQIEVTGGTQDVVVCLM
jgi:Xaa-Pro aminopeptidase